MKTASNYPMARYARPGHSTLEGHIVGASPVQLGVLIMKLADGKTIAVDSDYITEIKPYTSTLSVDVRPGDVVVFDDTRMDVTIEEVAPMQTDGWTILRANDDTWSLALKNTDTIRVLNK